MIEDETWKRQGTCAEPGQPRDLWHSPYARGQHEAAKICRRDCPVIEQCLMHALSTREWHGVWGGTTEHERRIMLARGTYKAS